MSNGSTRLKLARIIENFDYNSLSEGNDKSIELAYDIEVLTPEIFFNGDLSEKFVLANFWLINGLAETKVCIKFNVFKSFTVQTLPGFNYVSGFSEVIAAFGDAIYQEWDKCRKDEAKLKRLDKQIQAGKQTNNIIEFKFPEFEVEYI